MFYYFGRLFLIEIQLFPRGIMRQLSQSYVRGETVMLSLFRNYFSDLKKDLCLSMCGNYHTYKVEVPHYHHAVHTDVITMYDIIKFYIEIVYGMI